MRGKRVVAFALSCMLLLINISALSGCKRSVGEKGGYTYNTYVSSLSTNWNPHTWQVNADREIIDYITSPLVSIQPLDTNDGTFQWVYEMASSVADVTAKYRDNLTKYKVNLPSGLKIDDIDSGYVFEISLNKKAKWEDGVIISADDYIESMRLLLSPEMKNYRANTYVSGDSAIAGGRAYYNGESDFDAVGIYKVDDYTFHYVCESRNDINYLLTSFTGNWLVNKAGYEAGYERTESLLSTDYNTTLARSYSYGPYKISKIQAEKEMVLVPNENWYGWQRNEDGRLVSYTDFLVNGEHIPQYVSTKIVMSVMDEGTARSKFLKGELSVYAPSAQELSTYSTSSKLYSQNETYTMSFFFNTDVDALRKMDNQKGNANSVVLSNLNFRKAFSLCIDREEFCYSTAGWTPEYALMNDLYYYDIYNDADSQYRSSPQAMQAVCDLYGVKYGLGTPYPTLEAAYASINGYNLTQARELMKTAYRELSGAGLYSGGEIKIKIGYSNGALTSDNTMQCSLIERYLNLAIKDTGFGKITLEPVGNIPNRYGDVANGEYAIGYGAWGGAAFYPFRNLQVYMDNDKYSLHEGGCWSPDKEYLTIKIAGVDVTKTYKEWSGSMVGNGEFADADFDTKLAICSTLEREFLQKYYRIPLAARTSSELLSYQVMYLTDRYNIMYGYGGMRLMRYLYDDYEFSLFVAENGNRLSYE